MPRPRKPTAILDLTGRLKHDRKRFADRANEPVENGPLGDPPTYLGLDETAIWRELQAQLVEGVALASDRVAFELMVRLVYKQRRNELAGPELPNLIKLYGLFGMTPSDRSRVAVPSKKADENPFASLG